LKHRMNRLNRHSSK